MKSKKNTFGTSILLVILFTLICISTVSFASAQPTIHVTDLWRPHGDPDDHWDLATQYALAYQQQIDLKAILIDYPLINALNDQGKRWFGDPDVISVATMNLNTALSVPVMIGSPHQLKKAGDLQPEASISDHCGINQLLNILSTCPEPVIIHITGSSRDIAIAGKKNPKLFAEKCKAVYLNAGVAFNTNSECNVNYDAVAFKTIFDLPCPVYWLPCIMRSAAKSQPKIPKGEFSSHYSMPQKDILPFLSLNTQKFFAYMYRDGFYQKDKKQHDVYWTAYLKKPIEQDVIDYHSQQIREMWCTAGFIHAAGKTVTKNGKIVPLNQASDQAVFTFDPIEIEFKDLRNFTWKLNPTSKNRFIIHIKDQQNYEPAMNKAIKTLLLSLP